MMQRFKSFILAGGADLLAWGCVAFLFAVALAQRL